MYIYTDTSAFEYLYVYILHVYHLEKIEIHNINIPVLISSMHMDAM